MSGIPKEPPKGLSEEIIYEFRFSDSEIPVIRAGGANLDFFLGFIFVWMVNHISTDFGIGSVPKFLIIGAGCLALFQLYRASLSKISVTRTKLCLTGSIDRIEIPLQEIQSVKIWAVHTSPGGALKIKERGRLIPRYFFFPVLPGTTEKLKEALKDYLVGERCRGTERTGNDVSP